jgi:dipeptidyl aminopeptidase/acylaminoacyl peptidase
VRAVVQAPDVFRVGFAIYPVVDLYNHRAQLMEPYMGLRQEAYENASRLRLADCLEGNLLLIHGTSDVDATFSATIKMVEALTRTGKPHDLIVLPGDNIFSR